MTDEFDGEIMRTLQGKLHARIAAGDPCGPFYAAVVAADGTIVAESANSVVPENCSHNHAEMNVIRMAEEKLDTWNLSKRGLTLYTTAEPCMMCVGGILWSGIERVVYGVGTEAVERITGFDEGFKSHWCEEFSRRGISVKGPVLPEVGEEVMRLYMTQQGIVYSPQRSRLPRKRNLTMNCRVKRVISAAVAVLVLGAIAEAGAVEGSSAVTNVAPPPYAPLQRPPRIESRAFDLVYASAQEVADVINTTPICVWRRFPARIPSCSRASRSSRGAWN